MESLNYKKSLNQPIALWPLMRKSRAFASVAGWARNHDIFGAITASATQRDYVIHVISITDLSMAIIATAFLGFVLPSYIMGGIVSLGVQLSGTTALDCRTRSFSIFRSPFPHVLCTVPFVFRPPSLSTFAKPLLIGLPKHAPIFLEALFIGDVIGAAILYQLFFFRLVPTLHGCLVAFLIRFIIGVVARSNPLVVCQSMITNILSLTRFAARAESICILRIAMKVFSRGWLPFFALGALFERYVLRCDTIIHSNSPFVTLLTPADDTTRRAGNCFPASIIAQVSANGQV